MKLTAKKNGKGFLSGYSVSVATNTARRCGFFGENGERRELDIIENPDEKSITIKVQKAGD